LPEPTAAELAKEAEQEAAVFAQAVNVDKLLTMLRGLDPAKDNLADNEEIQVRTNNHIYADDQITDPLPGIIPIEHGVKTQDCQVDR
jgi:hypothetical protein